MYDYLFKIIIIGDSGVGKSCLLKRLIEGKFALDHDITIGVDFFSIYFNELVDLEKALSLKKTSDNTNLVNRALPKNNLSLTKTKTVPKIKLEIWDTAGQETFRSITQSYYRNVIGVIVCYDTTNHISFTNVQKWITDIKNINFNPMYYILVGTKSDCIHLKQVDSDKGKNFATQNNMLFCETSSKLDINVKDIFVKLTENIYSNCIIAGSKSNHVGIKKNDGKNNDVDANKQLTKSGDFSCCVIS